MPTGPRFALACLLAAACSSGASTPSTPNQDAGGEVPFVGDGSVDTPYAFACNNFPGSPNLVSLVEEPAGTPPPPAAGGQILAGTYYLTAGLIYERPSSCTSPDLPLAVTYRIAPSNTTSGSLDEILRGAIIGELRVSGRYSTKGTSFSATQTCPPKASDDGGAEDSVPYTATETEFRLYDVSASCGTRILVLTKQ
jgi:hypothetical protein